MIGRIKRKIVEHISASNKESFLKWQSQHLPKTTGDINYDVVSFSGAKAFADQLLSIYTFYRNVGKPVSWKIYSDGTYSQEQILALESIEGVKVLPFRFDAEVLPSAALSKYPTLKKVEIRKTGKRFNSIIYGQMILQTGMVTFLSHTIYGRCMKEIGH